MRKAFAPITCGVIVILASLILPGACSGARARQGAPLVTVRDAETESLIRSFANPLFRAAGVDPALVRITILQAWAINAFVAPGNRMFIHTGLVQHSDSAAEFAGVLAHETGHIAAQHLAACRSSSAPRCCGASPPCCSAARPRRGRRPPMLGGQTLAMREVFAFTPHPGTGGDGAGEARRFPDNPRTTPRRYTAEHRSAPFAPQRADLAHATERANMSDEDRRAEERARRRR